MKKIIVTTSWDDGHKLDLKMAELLCRYGIKSTFYVSPKNREFNVTELLADEEIKKLGRDFEIGAHTMTHPRLSAVSLSDAKKEIEGSKQYLEQLLGKPVASFCYPGGDYKEAHKKIVREADFKLARTVDRFTTILGKDCFAVPTTIHAYRHWSDALSILKQVGPERFLRCYLNWDELAIVLFEKVKKEGGIFHLWGHSWEIEKNGDWSRLEYVLDYISSCPEISYLTNGELV